jgi:hypothetical protein
MKPRTRSPIVRAAHLRVLFLAEAPKITIAPSARLIHSAGSGLLHLRPSRELGAGGGRHVAPLVVSGHLQRGALGADEPERSRLAHGGKPLGRKHLPQAPEE